MPFYTPALFQILLLVLLGAAQPAQTASNPLNTAALFKTFYTAQGHCAASWGRLCSGFADPEMTTRSLKVSSSSVLNVDDPSALAAALAMASGGETLMLAGGDYGSLSFGKGGLSTAHLSAPVTLRAADPGDPPVLSGLSLNDAHGLVFEDLVLDYAYQDGDPVNAVLARADNCSGLTFRDVRFVGDLPSSDDPAIDGYPAGFGLRLRNCTDIQVEDSSFTQLWKGIMVHESANVRLNGNTIHGLRSDGINVVDSRNILIEQNEIRDFARSYHSGDHADMIQFWIATHDPGQITSNVIIRDNLLDIGSGGWTQSIFFGNPQASSGGAEGHFRFTNIEISNNVVVNDHTGGIKIGAADGLVVANNTLLHGIDPNAKLGNYNASIAAPEIQISGLSDNVAILDNVSPTQPAGQPGWQVAGNLVAQDRDPAAPGHYDTLFLNGSGGFSGAIDNAIARPGSLIDQAGAGATRLQYDPAPEDLTALILSSRGAAPNTFLFDAGLSAGPDGLAGAAGATFSWDLGDGTTATGAQLRYSYGAPGTYTVVLTVTLPDGRQDSHQGTLTLTGGDLLHFDAGGGGILDLSAADPAPLDTDLPLTANGTAIALDGTTLPTIHRGQFDSFLGSDGFTLDMSLRADGSGSAHGVLLQLHGVLRITVTATGQVAVQMHMGDGSVTKLATGTSQMLDGRWHDLTLRYDGQPSGAGLEIELDGALLAQTDLSGALPASSTRPMTFGSSFQQSFRGEVSAFDLSLETGWDEATGPLPTLAPPPLLRPDSLETLFALHDEHDQSFDAAADPDLLQALSAGASLTTTGDDRAVLELAGGGHFAMGALDMAADNAVLALCLEFARHFDGDERGMLVQNFRSLEVALVGDRLKVGVMNSDGTMSRHFSDREAALTGSDLNRLHLVVDSDQDRLHADLNGRTILTVDDIEFDLPGALQQDQGWTLGNRWGGDPFAVTIETFAIADFTDATVSWDTVA